MTVKQQQSFSPYAFYVRITVIATYATALSGAPLITLGLSLSGYLYDFLKYAKMRDAKEDVDKVCIDVRKTSDNAGGKPTRGISL